MNNVFVYGTLKQGSCRMGCMRGQLMGEAVITGTLYNLGSFPALKLKGDGEVQGELWEVDDETLLYLDMIEGDPDFYKRETIEIDTLDFGTGLTVVSFGSAFAYVYQGEVNESDIIEGGVWTR